MMALGYGLKKSNFLPDATWWPIEKLSINLLYPGLLIPTIWGADLFNGSAGAPGAAASYLLARQMGGDAPLIVGVIALTTVVSALMIPLLLFIYHLT